MKRIIVVLFCLAVLLVVGCSPVRYIYQQPYQGVLTNAVLDISDYGQCYGTLTFDNKTVVVGALYDTQGKIIQSLELGEKYRLVLKEFGTYYNYYYVEKISN